MLRLPAHLIRRFSGTSSALTYPQVCIIGSGPAGFYTAQQILKGHPEAQIDIYEKLPVPFGLVRYGVAPDHPEVKNCINTFTEAAKNERVSFFGNIDVGKDITLPELKESYHAIVLAYGAARDRSLGIPGENLDNVISARRFVGWYNGLPEDVNLPMDLDIEDVAVIGHGNVGIDVSRILLTSVDVLKKTDIPEPVLEKLSKSRVKRVSMIGRRRAQNVAFTIKELREMINLKGCKPLIRTEDVSELSSIIASVSRPRKRLLELLHKTGVNPTPAQLEEWGKTDREWILRFLRSPKAIISTEDGKALKGVQLTVNRIENDKAIDTDETEFLDCGLVLRSIGFTSIKIDSSIPFDERRGIIPNEEGRVTGHPGLYVSGWVGTGPVGVLLATMQSGFTTGKAVVADLKSSVVESDTKKEGKKKAIQVLVRRRVRPVSFYDWGCLDRFEVEEGKKYGKPREKVVDLNKMVEIAHKDHSI